MVTEWSHAKHNVQTEVKSAVRMVTIATLLGQRASLGQANEIAYLKGARYSYHSVVLRNVLSLSTRRPQIDLRG